MGDTLIKEKKLTDGQIINALKAIDKETLAFAYDKEKRKFEYVTAKEILDIINRQKAEIERLTKDLELALDIKETISGLGKSTDKLLLENENLLKENAELQKQVEKLKIALKNVIESNEELIEECEQSVKDTAKEILSMLSYYDSVYSFKKKITERYGVEVE